MKIMIVEDKLITREGLVRLIQWDTIGATVVAACESAEQAIQLLPYTPVDLVITDIRMGEISGIHLTSHIKENYPTTEVILLTAYQDFTYAHEALDLGVFSYILKPVDEVELLEKVALVGKKIADKQRNQDKMTAYEKSQTAEILLNYITGMTPSSQPLQQKLETLGQNPRHLNAILVILRGFGTTFLPQNILSYFEASTAPGIHFILNEFAVGLLFISVETFQKNAPHNMDFLHSHSPDYIRLCVSGTIPDINALPDAFYRTMALHQHSFLHNLGKIVHGESLPLSQETGKEGKVFFAYEDISGCYIWENRQKLATCLTKTFQSFIDERSGISSILHQCVELGHYIDRLYARLDWELPEVSYASLLNPKTLRTFFSIRSLEEYLVNTVLAGFDAACEERKTQHRPIVRRALDFALENINNPSLNLKMVSDHTRVSYEYLSKAIKEDCGQNYTDFINIHRIERAKKYLAEQNYKIYDIAPLVGLELKNFYRLFKKYTGTTPLDFQRLER